MILKKFSNFYCVLENCVKGLDSDEYQFLNEIDKAKRLREQEMLLEEKKEIEEVKISFFCSQSNSLFIHDNKN